MLRIILSTLVLLVLMSPLAAQEAQHSPALQIVRLVADNVIKNNPRTVVHRETGESYTDTADLPEDQPFRIESRYMEWRYWNGVLNLAMLELFDLTGEETYREYSMGNYRYLFEHMDFFQSLQASGIGGTGMEPFFRMGSLDDCGAMAAGLTEVYRLDDWGAYRAYLDSAAKYIMNEEHRLADGTLARTGPYNKTLWLDDLYMSVPFLARYGELTGEDKYFRFAAKQVKQFTEYLYDDHTGLYFHCYYDTLGVHGVARWGRANGWSIMAQANLLDILPENHPERDTLLSIFHQQVLGLSRYQSATGLWHQLLDKTDSYLETSCSAMFTYAVAKGVNEGWLEEGYETIARRGWEGLKSKIRPDGKVEDICVGTWIKNDLVFYYERPTRLNDIHGLGAVILAGVEIARLHR